MYYVYSKMKGTLLKQHRHVGVEKDYWKLTFGVQHFIGKKINKKV